MFDEDKYAEMKQKITDAIADIETRFGDGSYEFYNAFYNALEDYGD